MPKTLSTPLLLKALSKKESATSHPTQKPNVLSTADLTLQMTNAQEKHVSRLKQARRKKYLEKKKRLPELTEGVYKKIYGERRLPQEAASSQEPSSAEPISSSGTTNKENDAHASNSQHSNTWPKTPIPRKQIPRREIRKRISVKSIMKDADQSTKPHEDSLDAAPREEQKSAPDTAAHQEDENLDIEYRNVMKTLEQEGHEPAQEPLRTPAQTRKTSNVEMISPSVDDKQSEASDTPSMKRITSHIDDMKKYLDDLSEPEVLHGKGKSGARKRKKMTSSPDAHARTKIPVSSSMPSPLAAKAKANYSQEHSSYVLSSTESKPFYSPMDPHHHAVVEDNLSNPSASPEQSSRSSIDETGVSRRLRLLRPRMPKDIPSRRVPPSIHPLQLHTPASIQDKTAEQHVQVPTPSTHQHTSDYVPFENLNPQNSEEEETTIDDQKLFEYGAPSSLHEFNLNLGMSSLTEVDTNFRMLSRTATDIDMDSMTLSDVNHHIASVCDGLQSSLYVPLLEAGPTVRTQPRTTTRNEHVISPPSHQFTNDSLVNAYWKHAEKRQLHRRPIRKKVQKKQRTPLWNIYTHQVKEQRRKRIHEIWTIQQKLTREFFEDNQSLFDEMTYCREQIRKEQAQAVRVKLRTTRAHALRVKKNSSSAVTTPTIRATIRSSQNSYNIAMHQNRCAEIIAKLFLRYLRFLSNLKKEREHALLLVDDEDCEFTARNALTIWKNYADEYRGEYLRKQYFEVMHTKRLLARYMIHWRQCLDDKLRSKEQQQIADAFLRKSLLRKAFVSLQLAHTERMMDDLRHEMASRWALSTRLVKAFHAWKCFAQRGNVIKEKLMNLAFSKQQANQSIDEQQHIEFGEMKLRVQQNLLKGVYQEYSTLASQLKRLRSLNRLFYVESGDTSNYIGRSALMRSLEKKTTTPEEEQASSKRKSLSAHESSFLQRALSLESTGRVAEASPVTQSPSQTHFLSSHQIAESEEHFSKVNQLRRDIAGIQSEIASINRKKKQHLSQHEAKQTRQKLSRSPVSLSTDESLEEMAHHSYSIKLMRRMLSLWRIRLREKEMEHEADDIREYNVKRKLLLRWRRRAVQIKSAREKVEQSHRQSVLRQFFATWKQSTERLLDLKDSIAEHCHTHHVLRRTFTAWKQYSSHAVELREREQIFTQHRRLTLLRYYFMSLRDATRQSQINTQLNDIADRHYKFILMHSMVQHWRGKTEKRQLLRRVFSLALKGYRKQVTVPEGVEEERLKRRCFNSWKKRTAIGVRLKERRLQRKVAKHWYTKQLKIRMFSQWKSQYEKNSKADAHCYTLLLRRARTILRQWRKITEENRIMAERENQIMKQIANRFLVKRVFHQWRRHHLMQKEQDEQALKFQNKRPPAIHTQYEAPMKVLPSDSGRLSPSASARPASSTDEYSPFEEDEDSQQISSNARYQRYLNEYRKAHDSAKHSNRELYSLKSKEYGQALSISQIYYHKQLKAKVWKCWLQYIERKRAKILLQERADHFYNRKLQKARFNNTAISTSRLEENLEELPPYFQPTYRIVNYRLLLRALQHWKEYTREEKTTRLGIAIASRFHTKLLMKRFFEKWKSRLELLSYSEKHDKPTRGPPYSSGYSGASSYTRRGSEELSSYGDYSPLYRPARVTSNEISLDHRLFGKPRRPYSLYSDSTPGSKRRILYESPRI